MSTPATTPARPSLFVMIAATVAGPLQQVVTILIGLLLIVLGLMKVLPAGTVALPSGAGSDAASVNLLALATGGVITAPWGPWLIGGLQILLGIGLLIPAARPMAGLGCLLAAAGVLVGFFANLSSITEGNGLNQAGVALVLLVVVLLAGAAGGTRAAARRLGVPT